MLRQPSASPNVGQIAPSLGQTIGALFAAALLHGLNQPSVPGLNQPSTSRWSAPCPLGGSASVALPANLSAAGPLTLSNTATTWNACAFTANNSTVVANGQTTETGTYTEGQFTNAIQIQGSLAV